MYAKSVRSLKGWGGIGGIAALRRRGKPARDVRRRRTLHYPNGAPTYITVFANSSTKDWHQRGSRGASAAFVRDRNELIDKGVSKFILRLNIE